MKKNYLFFITAFLASLLEAQTPITLGNANMPGSNDTLRYTDVDLSSLGNYTQTGINFNWDFKQVVSTTQGVREFKSSLQTPYALFFLSLNEYGEKIVNSLSIGPVTIDDYYNFYKKQTSPAAFVADGAGVSFSNIPVPSYYSDKDEIYNFPMSYPKYDSTTFRFATPATTIIPLRYSKTGYRVTRVDGWGTIATPNGTANCLRLVTTQYSLDSVKTSIGPIIIPLGVPNNVRSYQWLSTTAKIPVMEITGNLLNGNFVLTQARYRGYPVAQDPTGILENGLPSVRFYPNPVRDKLYLDQDLSGGRLEIVDLAGKVVYGPFAIGFEKECVVDVSNLATGVYLVKITSDKGNQAFKFVKEPAN